jgi:hypothetical protein
MMLFDCEGATGTSMSGGFADQAVAARAFKTAGSPARQIMG